MLINAYTAKIVLLNLANLAKRVISIRLRDSISYKAESRQNANGEGLRQNTMARQRRLAKR